MNLQIKALDKEDLVSLKNFMDEVIAPDYFKSEELEAMYSHSFLGEANCSFVLRNGENLKGARITYPPGCWTKGKGDELCEDKWPHPKNETAYFQTIFLDPSISGKGWGRRLSERSIDVLRVLGVKGVVCHSWKESPHDSSNKYLTALGFLPIAEHPSYWKRCSCGICITEPCYCTAVEMYLDLERL